MKGSNLSIEYKSLLFLVGVNYHLVSKGFRLLENHEHDIPRRSTWTELIRLCTVAMPYWTERVIWSQLGSSCENCVNIQRSLGICQFDFQMNFVECKKPFFFCCCKKSFGVNSHMQCALFKILNTHLTSISLVQFFGAVSCDYDCRKLFLSYSVTLEWDTLFN